MKPSIAYVLLSVVGGRIPDSPANSLQASAHFKTSCPLSRRSSRSIDWDSFCSPSFNMASSEGPSEVPLGQYIFERIRNLGIEHIFGVSRDFNLNPLDHS